MYGERNFENLNFTKKGAEIIDRAKARLTVLSGKIDDKKSQIQIMCREYNITAEKMFLNLDTLRGQTSAGLPSAEMQKIQKLASDVDEAEKEVKLLALIVRNLDPKREFDLAFDELKYFEF